MTVAVQDWEADVVDLKQQGLETAEIATRLDKHPATIRKAVARARDRGALADDRVLSSDEASATFGNEIPGQTTVEDHLPPEDDPEHTDDDGDPLEEFKREAGEAVGAMPPATPEATDPEVEHRLKGTRQIAFDLGPEMDVPQRGQIVIKSPQLPSGFYGMGDVITGTFTARIVKVAGEEKEHKASGEYRARPQAHVALITELDLD